MVVHLYYLNFAINNPVKNQQKTMKQARINKRHKNDDIQIKTIKMKKNDESSIQKRNDELDYILRAL